MPSVRPAGRVCWPSSSKVRIAKHKGSMSARRLRNSFRGRRRNNKSVRARESNNRKCVLRLVYFGGLVAALNRKPPFFMPISKQLCSIWPLAATRTAVTLTGTGDKERCALLCRSLPFRRSARFSASFLSHSSWAVAPRANESFVCSAKH